MFKVISAEYKKILSKPGIFILSVILAIILVLGVNLYKPTVYEDTNITLGQSNSTFMQKYTLFMGNQYADKKSEIDSTLLKSINTVKNYRINNTTSEVLVNNALTKFENALKNYRNSGPDNTMQEEIDNTLRPAVVRSLGELNDLIGSLMIRTSTGSYVMLTTQSNYDNYLSIYDEIYRYFNVSSVDKSEVLSHASKYDNEYKKQFEKILNNFIFPSLEDSIIDDYIVDSENSSLHILNTRLNAILDSINEKFTIAKSNPSEDIALAKDMDSLANQYINIITTYTNLIKYDLLSNAFSYTNLSIQPDLMYLNVYSEFNTDSLLVKYSYLFENNQTDNMYANPLTMGVSSNNEINAYDYAYFVLRLFTFVIIAYAVMMSCSTIAGEIKDGSMRYYAIRPISRTEIFIGKLLAILSLSTILLLFSTVIAVLVGGTVYSFSSLPILTVFNGNTPIVLSPIAMLGIFILSTLLEIIVYTCIAMLVSSLFKSDLFAITLMLVIYLVNSLLPVFITGYNTWLAFYPFSHINLYSLFGSSVYALPNNLFNLILGSKVFMSTNIFLTLSMIVILVIISILLAIKLFRKKEL